LTLLRPDVQSSSCHTKNHDSDCGSAVNSSPIGISHIQHNLAYRPVVRQRPRNKTTAIVRRRLEKGNRVNPELLRFWTLSIVWNFKYYKTQRFGNLVCFRPSSGEGRETPTLLGPLERANLTHWNSNSVCYTPSSEYFRFYLQQSNVVSFLDPLSNNGTITDERCFLYGPCRGYITENS
jgi:hypothetical protein